MSCFWIWLQNHAIQYLLICQTISWKKDIVRAALRVAKEVDATDEEWQTFMKMLKERKR